jgi:hypothetical protein
MKGLAVVLLLFLTGRTAAQDFTRLYQDSADLQVAMHLLKDSSGGFWLGGYRVPSGENTRAWMAKVDAEGNVIRRFDFPGEETQIWAGMVFTENGMAAVIGLQQFTGETRYYLASIRNDSLRSWRHLPELENAALHDSRPAAGNRLLISGFKGSPGIAGNDFFLARINTDSAKTDWLYYEEFGPNDHISTCRELPDKSVLFCGTVAEQGNYNPCMGKLDSAGQLRWLQVLTTPWNDGSQKFELESNGDIWLVGESSTSAGPEFDTELFRLDSAGNLLWAQWIGSPGQDAAFHIQKKLYGPGFWVAGYSNATQSGTGPISPFLMSLDGEGNSLGEAFWPMPAPSPVYDMQAIGDSVFYFCGTSQNSAFLMRRKNPLLVPVFTVENKALILVGSSAESLRNFYKAYRQGLVSEAWLVDFLGRRIGQVQFSGERIVLPMARSPFRIGWTNNEGRLFFTTALLPVD